MDSGPFLDIIPILLGHLDLLSLIRLAQACRFWKRRIYGDLKLWPNVIELPFICHMRVYDCKCHDTEKTIQDSIPFMALCRRCGLHFNELKNEKEMLRLYLPGTYSRYGHSCSSFNCCGSGIPQYASSLECQYSHHTKCVNLSSKWHPEYMFLKFEPDKFPLVFTSRRNLNPCYAVWNKTQQHQNKTSEMNESIHVFSDFR
ncbi:unnamed protein product [Rotaria socialis]